MEIEKTVSTVYTPLDDGNGVVLNIDTLDYYSLNRTGSWIWSVIEEHSHLSFDDLVDRVCRQFEVSEDAARIDVHAFVEHLARFQMVRTVEAA